MEGVLANNVFLHDNYDCLLFFADSASSIHDVGGKYKFKIIVVVNEWFDGKLVFKKRSMHNLKIGTVMVEYIIKRHIPELTKLDNMLD